MKRTTTVLFTGTALGALLLAGCGSSSDSSSSSGADGLTTVKIGYTPITAAGALVVGQDQGFFKEEGLTLEMQQVDNPPAGIAAVAGGNVDYNYAPSIPIVNAVSNGVKIKVVAAADGYAEGTRAKFEADPESVDDDTAILVKNTAITSAKDLAGKTVSVPARGAQLEVTIANAIKQDGGDPSTVNWITLDFPSALSSLKDDRIDAAGVVQPFVSNGVAEGDKVLAKPGLAFFEDGAVGMWVTSEKYATANPELVAKYQRAVAKTNAYANDHVDEVYAAASTLLKIDLATLKAGAPPYFNTTVTVDDLGRVVTKLDDLGYLKAPVDASTVVIAQP